MPRRASRIQGSMHSLVSTLPKRFWEKIEPEPNSGCWIWIGASKQYGYGCFGWLGKIELAHRLIYRHMVGSIPDDLELDHKCRFPACVNPRHLEPVTHRENMLRGENPTALNSRRMICSNGHPFNPENTYIPPSEPRRRRCRICMRKQQLAWDTAHAERCQWLKRRWLSGHPGYMQEWRLRRPVDDS